MARIPGQGVAASTGGPTTPGTATTEVQEPGATSPLLGLTPPDFTNWSLLLPEALLTGGLPAPLGGPPGIGRQTAGPWAPSLWAPAPPMQALSAPQGMLPIHQQRLCQPAAPYQQVVQPPRRPAGRGGVANSPSAALLLQTVNPPQNTEGSRPGDMVSGAGQSVTLGVDEGQPLMSPQLPPQEPLNLSQATVQGQGTPTQLC